MEDCLKIAENSFNKIRLAFPSLNMEFHDNEDLPVDLIMDIPKQNGLSFDISLNLQNRDELHISACELWISFFPITNPKYSEEFTNAVIGLINGNYRIVQHVRNEKIYKVLLEKLENNEWIKIGGTYKKLKFPWTKLDQKIIQNNQEENKQISFSA